jgi:hypothetical protein
VTFGVRRQEWVWIAATWGSRSGDRLPKPGQKLGDRMTDGDVVGGLGDGDGGD